MKDPLLNAKDLWWQEGVAFFMQISGWLAGPVIVALFLGKWLDGRFGTKPWLFIICTGLAFLVTCYGLFNEARIYSRKLAANDNKDKKRDNDQIRGKPNSK